MDKSVEYCEHGNEKLFCGLCQQKIEAEPAEGDRKESASQTGQGSVPQTPLSVLDDIEDGQRDL